VHCIETWTFYNAVRKRIKNDSFLGHIKHLLANKEAFLAWSKHIFNYQRDTFDEMLRITGKEYALLGDK